DEGYIAWQLHGGIPPKEVTFKDVEIRAIEPRQSPREAAGAAAAVAPGAKAAAVPRPSSKAEAASGRWRVEGAELVQADLEGEGRHTLYLGESSLSRYVLSFQAQIVAGAEAFFVNFHDASEEDRGCFYVGDDGRTLNHVTFASRNRGRNA